MKELDARIISAGLERNGLFREIHVEPSVDSTNTRLAEWVREGRAGPGVLLAAEVQTAGRGRMGREWRSPPRSGLTFSFTLPDYFPGRPGLLTVGTALAAAEAIRRETRLSPSIKWPNDLCLGTGKLAGILARTVAGPSGPLVVMGVGINVNAAPSPSDSRHGLPPVCLRGFTGREVDRNRLLAAVLRETEGVCRRFARGEYGFVASGLRARSLLVGRRARFSFRGRVFSGIVRDHTEALAVVLETAAGTVELPGEAAELLGFDFPR